MASAVMVMPFAVSEAPTGRPILSITSVSAEGPKTAEKAAPTLQKQPVQEKEQEKQADAQSRQEGPVAQQAQRPKKGSRSERDSHATKTSSSTPRESGSTGKTPERPSVLERLKVYRTQLDQKSAPTRQKTKDRHKTR